VTVRALEQSRCTLEGRWTGTLLRSGVDRTKQGKGCIEGDGGGGGLLRREDTGARGRGMRKEDTQQPANFLGDLDP
jgi:hypothetical protein